MDIHHSSYSQRVGRNGNNDDELLSSYNVSQVSQNELDEKMECIASHYDVDGPGEEEQDQDSDNKEVTS